MKSALIEFGMQWDLLCTENLTTGTTMSNNHLDLIKEIDAISEVIYMVSTDDNSGCNSRKR